MNLTDPNQLKFIIKDYFSRQHNLLVVWSDLIDSGFGKLQAVKFIVCTYMA